MWEVSTNCDHLDCYDDVMEGDCCIMNDDAHTKFTEEKVQRQREAMSKEELIQALDNSDCRMGRYTLEISELRADKRRLNTKLCESKNKLETIKRLLGELVDERPAGV